MIGNDISAITLLFFLYQTFKMKNLGDLTYLLVYLLGFEVTRTRMEYTRV